jgi:hypothetical protein
VLVPLDDETFDAAGASAGFGGSATGEDLQRGTIVYSVQRPGSTAAVDLLTQATFAVPVSRKSAYFDDPVNARLSGGRLVSLVRVPTNAGLAPGIDYALHARLVAADKVVPLPFNGSLTLLAPDARGASPIHAWNTLTSWLPSKLEPRAPAGVDLSLSVPRPALQLAWNWSGGPEIRGNPPALDDGANKILGVDLRVHYPKHLIRVLRAVAPAGRELVIWSQDDRAGELAIQAVSRDGQSVNHVEVVFELVGSEALDPADPIDGVRVELRKAVDEHGYPADGGARAPWSLALAEVTVR